jgi:hypothetical protein
VLRPRTILFGLFPVASVLGFVVLLSGMSVATILLVGMVCAIAGFGAGFLSRRPRSEANNGDWRTMVYNPKEFRHIK